VPAKTPKETIVAIRNAVVAALHTPDVSKRLTEMSSNVIASEPQEFAAFLQSKVDGIARVVAKLRLAPDSGK